MHRVLLLSSHVAHGAVGIKATSAPFQQAGIDVVALPTIVLSNHPGYARFAGTAVDPRNLADMTSALDANGWLADLSAVVTGYLPSAAHVDWACAVAERVRTLNREALVVCDPVLGDDPGGLYIDPKAANAIRETLAPLADVITPNRFELSWLSGIDVQSCADCVSASHTFPTARTFATSIPARPDALLNVLTTHSGTWTATVTKIRNAPHGTGDLFTGFLVSELVQGADDTTALACAVGGVRHALEICSNNDDLPLADIDWLRGIMPAIVTPWT